MSRPWSINFLPEHRELIRARIDEGCKFRFLLFDTTSDNASALDASLGYSNGSLIKHLEPALGTFREFQKALAADGIAPGKFDARTFNTVPPWGLVAVDRDLQHGRIFVELNGLGVEGSVCPGFCVIRSNGGWYDFFESQLDAVWKASKPLYGESTIDPVNRLQSVGARQ